MPQIPVMKILVIHCIYQFKGGEETVVSEEVALLRNAGHSVSLLSFSNDGNTLAKLLQMPFNISSYLKTRKAIRRFSPDVVHVHNLHFGASPSVVYAVKHSGVPLVCTLHNFRLLCPSAMLFHNEQPFLDSLKGGFPWKAVKLGVTKNSKLLTFWLALSLQLHYRLKTWRIPGRYIVLSQHAKNVFLQSGRRFNPEQLVVKTNFASVPKQPLEPAADEFLFVGRLAIEKGVHLLLKTFAASGQKITLAGDGPLKEEVIAYTKYHPNIRYVGKLAKEELFALMRKSSALVFPSIWYEGMPLTIIEAFACGLPVIASRLGTMEYMITQNENGLLFACGNEQEFQAALNEWAALPATEKQRYRENARTAYETLYTPEKNATQLLNIYQSVAKKAVRPSLALAG